MTLIAGDDELSAGYIGALQETVVWFVPGFRNNCRWLDQNGGPAHTRQEARHIVWQELQVWVTQHPFVFLQDRPGNTKLQLVVERQRSDESLKAFVVEVGRHHHIGVEHHADHEARRLLVFEAVPLRTSAMILSIWRMLNLSAPVRLARCCM